MTTITIEGPGGNINFEAEIIREALEAEGIIVEVENDYPDSNVEEKINTVRERLRGPWGTNKDQPPIKKYATIKVLHMPWGG